MKHHETVVPIASETLEPFAAMLLGLLWARVEAANPNDVEDACGGLWMAMRGLQKIGIGVGTATHFSIAVMNEQSKVADLIKSKIGVDPIFEWKW